VINLDLMRKLTLGLSVTPRCRPWGFAAGTGEQRVEPAACLYVDIDGDVEGGKEPVS